MQHQRHATLPDMPPHGRNVQYEDSEEHVPFFTGCRREKKRYCIVTAMVLLWIIFTVLTMVHEVHDDESLHSGVSVPDNGSRSIWLDAKHVGEHVLVILKGPFLAQFKKPTPDDREMITVVEKVTFSSTPPSDLSTANPSNIQSTVAMSAKWTLYVLPSHEADKMAMEEHKMLMNLQPAGPVTGLKERVRILMTTTLAGGVAVLVEFELEPIDENTGVVAAALLLVGLYVLIGLELVNRALAALISAVVGIAVLAVFGQRPELTTIVAWIDIETMLLLFSMMVMVAILTKTGIFDYLSVLAFQVTRGKLWPMIFTLCIFAGVASSIIDIVTTVLLMTPVAIRLCEMLKLNPKPVLLSIIFAANIISALTPVGDPPNIILTAHPAVQRAGVDFATFVLHMLPGVVVCTLVLFLQLRYCFYRNAIKMQADEPTELKHEITVWQRTASSLSLYTHDEQELRRMLNTQVKRLQAMRRDSEISNMTTATNMTAVSEVIAHHEHPNSDSFEYVALLRDMRQKYPIRDKILLLKCAAVLAFTITFFFIGHSVHAINLSLGTTAFLGALLLLILADKEDMDGVLARVEWATLFFFAGLFIFMECLQELGLMDFLGRHMENAISSVPKAQQLLVAIMLILWVSAVASALMDSVPLMTMMVKIAARLSQTPALMLPLQPLVWTLAFACCFGGCGTLIGSAANVVCTGVAEQHGYKITMWEFSKIGLPVMFVAIAIISVYLILCHVVFEWH